MSQMLIIPRLDPEYISYSLLLSATAATYELVDELVLENAYILKWDTLISSASLFCKLYNRTLLLVSPVTNNVFVSLPMYVELIRVPDRGYSTEVNRFVTYFISLVFHSNF